MRVLLLLRGAPGCGKSTWIDGNGLRPYALSADEIRMLCASPKLMPDGSVAIDQSNDTLVWSTLFKLLETRMSHGEFTVIDATNSKTSEMNRYKELCDTWRYRMYCVDFTGLPIEECKRRNAQREPLKRVPEEVIDKMYSRFRTQKIPSGITVLQPDELDRIWMKKFDMNQWNRIHVIGDLHGCSTAFRSWLEDAGGFRDDEFYLFCGDYLDRGLENADMMQIMLELYQKPNVQLLEGNHERWLWIWANGGTASSKEFELHTRAQLEDAHIDRKDVRKFYRRLGQCAWFDYAGHTWLVTHGGLSAMPENLTKIAADQMIKGVGGYNACAEVYRGFEFNAPANCFQIHGHRNTQELPIAASDRCFNLEGKVEFGGCLRCLTLTPDGWWTATETQNPVFREPDRQKPQAAEDKPVQEIGDLILQMRQNKYIQEKRYGDISSFNFTKSAFYDKIWDEQTTKARGLYIDVPHQRIVARAYDKFFNINERPETKFDMLPFRLNFPVTAYVKENGFLGLASWNDAEGELFITTKSSPDGDYAVWLRGNMETLLGQERMQAIADYSKAHNATFVFECVDMVHDPHIIEYRENRLYLLDIIYNEMPMRKLPYAELCAVADQLGLRHKELAFVIETWQEFFDWYYRVLDEDYLYNGRHIEGFVLEDLTGNMLKLKLSYYNFWKFMRSVAHEVLRKGYIDGKRTAALTTPLANDFYGWLKRLRAEAEDPETLPKDICSLRRMFTESGVGANYREGA